VKESIQFSIIHPYKVNMRRDLHLFLFVYLIAATEAFIPLQHYNQMHRSIVVAEDSVFNVNKCILSSSSSISRLKLLSIFEAVGNRSVRDQQNYNRVITGALDELEIMYSQAASSIRCPFFRRRAADAIDNIAMIARFLVIRHKSLLNGIPLELEVPGCKAIGRHVFTNPDGTVCKYKNLSSDEIYEVVKKDWTEDGKGYYITGKLNSTIYRDDCLFDGPDPDMPVRGLRKYLAAASQLFDTRESSAQLLELRSSDDIGKYGFGLIEARWRIEGILMLPWRPRVQPWTGWTKYHIDEDGMIAFHEEGWDISVFEAFVGTIFPAVWEKLWGGRDKCHNL